MMYLDLCYLVPVNFEPLYVHKHVEEELISVCVCGCVRGREPVTSEWDQKTIHPMWMMTTMAQLMELDGVSWRGEDPATLALLRPALIPQKDAEHPWTVQI